MQVSLSHFCLVLFGLFAFCVVFCLVHFALRGFLLFGLFAFSLKFHFSIMHLVSAPHARVTLVSLPLTPGDPVCLSGVTHARRAAQTTARAAISDRPHPSLQAAVTPCSPACHVSEPRRQTRWRPYTPVTYTADHGRSHPDTRKDCPRDP